MSFFPAMRNKTKVQKSMVSNDVSILISEIKQIHPVILKKNVWHLDTIYKEIKLYGSRWVKMDHLY